MGIKKFREDFDINCDKIVKSLCIDLNLGIRVSNDTPEARKGSVK